MFMVCPGSRSIDSASFGELRRRTPDQEPAGGNDWGWQGLSAEGHRKKHCLYWDLQCSTASSTRGVRAVIKYGHSKVWSPLPEEWLQLSAAGVTLHTTAVKGKGKMAAVMMSW